MNRVLCGIVFFFTLCCMESCSLQRFLPFQHKKKNNMLTTDSANVGGNMFAIYPQPDTFKVVQNIDTALIARQLVAELTPVYAKRKHYSTFTGKAKVHFESPDQQQDFTAFIKVKKDSCIWVTIYGLGGMLNAARVLITHDSLVMINYINKEVTRTALDQVAKVLPVKADFSSLQNLIAGEPLSDGTLKDVAVLSGTWLLKIEDNNYLQTVGYNKADSNMNIDQVTTHDPNGPEATLRFENYELVNQLQFSRLRKVNIKNGADLYSIEMYFQNADFDKPFEIQFTVPSNYKAK